MTSSPKTVIDENLAQALKLHDELNRKIKALEAEKQYFRDIVVSYGLEQTFHCEGYTVSYITPPAKKSYDEEAMKKDGIDLDRYAIYKEVKPMYRIN